MYVPMPPLNSRSTGAHSTARTSSGGVISVTLSSMPSAWRTWWLRAIDFCSRLNTPPPSLISDLS